MNIYIGNLNYRVRRRFETSNGRIRSCRFCKIIIDRETGKSKGFASVEMPDDAVAKKAIAELNEAEYEGRQMVVKEARPRA